MESEIGNTEGGQWGREIACLPVGNGLAHTRRARKVS